MKTFLSLAHLLFRCNRCAQPFLPPRSHDLAIFHRAVVATASLSFDLGTGKATCQGILPSCRRIACKPTGASAKTGSKSRKCSPNSEKKNIEAARASPSPAVGVSAGERQGRRARHRHKPCAIITKHVCRLHTRHGPLSGASD